MAGHPSYLDVLLVLLVFLGLLSPGIIWVIWKVIREARADRRRAQTEAESLRDEGFPPGPPRPPPSI